MDDLTRTLRSAGDRTGPNDARALAILPRVQPALVRAFDTLWVWALAGALLSWPHLPARWRTPLALVLSAAGVFFLILAVNTEGVRETETLSQFLIGRPYVTQRAEALASLPYYVMSGVCFLLGTGGLALSEPLAERLRAHWLLWAIALSLLVTLLRFALEKLAAPQAWTQAVGITWAAPVVGAFFLYNVVREGRGALALVGALLLYGFGSRGGVAALMAVASSFRLGSHYDVSPIVKVINPLTRQVYEFEPGSLHQILYLGLLPQLGVWPLYTVLSGLIGAAVLFVLARLKPAPSARPPAAINPAL